MNTAGFLKLNPICIFCGGNTEATEQDHMPPRQIFRDRQWPEGYAFPACHSCNAITRNHEQFISVFAHFYPDSKTNKDQMKFKESLKGAWNNMSEPMEGLRPKARQVRKTLRKLGIEKDPNLGTWEYPLLNVSNLAIQESLKFFAQKLFCALHYKHTSKIVPSNAAIAWRWFSNIQAMEQDIPISIFTITPERPCIVRNGKSLQSQFDYGFGTTNTGEMGTYFATFGFSFALFGYISFDPDNLPNNIPGHDIVSPLRHHT